jgi:hypothetical protein
MLTVAPHQVNNLEAKAKHSTQQYESCIFELEAKVCSIPIFFLIDGLVSAY